MNDAADKRAEFMSILVAAEQAGQRTLAAVVMHALASLAAALNVIAAMAIGLAASDAALESDFESMKILVPVAGGLSIAVVAFWWLVRLAKDEVYVQGRAYHRNVTLAAEWPISCEDMGMSPALAESVKVRLGCLHLGFPPAPSLVAKVFGGLG